MPRQLITKTIGGSMLAALAITTSVERADADLGDALLGAGAAVIIGCATNAINCKGKKKTQRTQSSTVKRSNSGISAAQRQQNRDVQSALNTFGWPVGAVDGALGKRSRAAIRDYQGYMGYPATGQLTDYERQTLVDSWQKFNAGAGSAYPRTMAAVGPRGLLNIERDPSYPSQFGDVVGQNYGNQGGVNNQAGYNNQQGGYNTQQGGNWNQTQPAAATTQPQLRVQPLPNQVEQGGQVIGGGSIPKLKPLKPSGQVATSAAARCELVDQTTRIQGGVIQAANMTDPNQALSEKFCEARGFAITQGQSVAAQFAVSDNELASLCEQIKSGYASTVSALPNAALEQTFTASQNTAAQLGLSDTATASAYGQICLGVGYRLDDAEMALAGALTMLAAGQVPYAELVGHHIREGFGVNAAPNAAVPWYLNAVQALEQGAQPAFVPSTTSERIQVIRAALQVQEERANGVDVLPRVIPASNTLPLLNKVNQ